MLARILYSDLAGLFMLIASIPMLALGIAGITVAKSGSASSKVVSSVLFGIAVATDVILTSIDSLWEISGLTDSQVLWGAGAALQMALYMIAWNCIRQRSVWVNVAAGGTAIILGVLWRLAVSFVSDLWFPADAVRTGPAADFYSVFIYLIWVGLAFVGLLLMHFLGKAFTRPSAMPVVGGNQEPHPIGPADPRWDTSTHNTDCGVVAVSDGYTPKTLPAQTKTNTLAIVSLITAFFISIVAVITGHMALKQIERSGEQGRGLALTGLVIGYLGLVSGLVMVVVALSGMASVYSY